MAIGFVQIKLELPGCGSLKEKRGRLKPLLHRLHREFNVSVAEIDHQDIWKSALIGCVVITSNPSVTHSTLQSIVDWIEQFWPDVEVIEEEFEIF